MHASKWSSQPTQPPQSTANPPDQSKHPQTTLTSDEAAREKALEDELEQLQRLNHVVEGMNASLDKAKLNMETVSRTVSQASLLLETWTRVLSQTEHNQRLILNPGWNGASQDIADAENEVLRRRRENERREVEERQKREEAEQRRREEEERRQKQRDAVTPKVKTTRGSSAGGRGTRGVSRGVPAAAATGTRGVGRAAASQYGRLGAVGTRSTSVRGRGRGVG